MRSRAQKRGIEKTIPISSIFVLIKMVGRLPSLVPNTSMVFSTDRLRSVRRLPRWLYEKMCQYNVFVPEEDDYDDKPDDAEEPAAILRRQRYATRLYVVLLLGE